MYGGSSRKLKLDILYDPHIPLFSRGNEITYNRNTFIPTKVPCTRAEVWNKREDGVLETPRSSLHLHESETNLKVSLQGKVAGVESQRAIVSGRQRPGETQKY